MVSITAAATVLALSISIAPVAPAFGEVIAQAPAIESVPPPAIDSAAPEVESVVVSEDKPDSSQPVLSGTIAAGPTDIDNLTNQIVKKEIDFLKLNANLKANETGHGPWAQRRWYGFNLANVALTATGAYINGAGRFSYLHKNRIKHAPKDLFEHAGWLRVTANFMTVGGGLAEAAAMAWQDHRETKLGTDLKTTRRYADKLQDELDGLITQRAQAVNAAGLAGPEKQLADTEGAVLSDVRNLAVNEFIRWYAQGRGNRAFNYTGFTMAILANGLAGAGGITGNYASSTHRKSTARWRTRLGGTGGIADIIAGSMNQSVPFVTRGVSKFVRNRAEHNTGAMLDKQEPVQLDQLHAHHKQYHELIAAAPQLNVHGTVLRDGIFAKEASILDQHEAMRLGENKAARHKLMSQLIFFSGIGAPKVINGIGTATGAFKYTNNIHERFEAIGGPALVYAVGYSVAEAELLRSQLWSEVTRMRNRKLGKQTPSQVLHSQIKELDSLTIPVSAG